jgi:hypothetical protein
MVDGCSSATLVMAQQADQFSRKRSVLSSDGLPSRPAVLMSYPSYILGYNCNKSLILSTHFIFDSLIAFVSEWNLYKKKEIAFYRCIL